MLDTAVFDDIKFQSLPIEVMADLTLALTSALIALLVYRVLKLNSEIYSNGDSLLDYLKRHVGGEDVNYFFIGAAMAKSKHENLSNHECRMLVVSWLRQEQGMSARDLSTFYVKAKADLANSTNMEAVKKGSSAYKSWLSLLDHQARKL